MKSLLPDTAKLRVETVRLKRPMKRLALLPPPVMVRFVYEETFTEEAAQGLGFTVAQLLDNTFAALKPHLKTLGLTFKRSGKRVRISGTIPRTQFGNMMISEFMGWSTVGTLTITDLFMGVMVGSSGVKMPHNVPSFPASPKPIPVTRKGHGGK